MSNKWYVPRRIRTTNITSNRTCKETHENIEKFAVLTSYEEVIFEVKSRACI